MAAEAIAADFYALGLHPDTIASALAQVSRVEHTGGGAGVMVPEGSPLGVYDVRVQVVSSGAPGAATVRWSFDAGATWTIPAVAPLDAPLVLGASGMAVRFEGAFVAGDLYAFTAVRALERHLSAANATARAHLRRRFREGLPAWDDSIIAAAVSLAALSLLTQRGFDPRNPGDKAVADRAAEGIKYLKDVGASIAHPDGAIEALDTAPVAFSDPPRED